MTQFLPTSDAFTGTAITSGCEWGSAVNMWTRIRPWDANVTYGSGGTEFSNVAFSTGYSLTDGYAQGRAKAGEIVEQPFSIRFSARRVLGPSVMPVDDQSPSSFPELGGFAFRNSLMQDGTVRARFGYVGTHLPEDSQLAAGDGLVRHTAVFARLQVEAGVGANDTAILDAGDPERERVEYHAGYVFMRCANKTVDGTGGYKYFLMRFHQGLQARLADFPVGEDKFSPYANVERGVPFELQIETTDNAGDVDIVCKVRKPGATVDTTVITYTDTNVLKVTGPGRTGFGMSNLHVAQPASAGVPTEEIGCAVEWIQAFEGSTLLYRDEFVRHSRENARPVLSAANTHYPLSNPSYATWQRLPFDGRSPQSSYFMDLQGLTTGALGGASGEVMVWDATGGGRVEVDGSAINANYDGAAWMVSQREETTLNQDHTISVVFSTAGSGDPGTRRAGIVLRETGLLGVPGSCYSIYVEVEGYSPITAATAVVSRWWNGGEEVLGEVDITGDVTADVAFVLEAASYNVDSGPGGVPQTPGLSIFIDTVQSVLAAPSAGAPAGVTYSAGGKVFDASSNRLSTGLGTGLHAYLEGAGSRHIYFDTWTVGVAGDKGPGDPVPPNDQASIFVSTEGSTIPASGTLTLPGSWPLSESTVRGVIRKRFESDHLYTQKRGSFNRRVWSCRGQAITGTDIDTIRTFWDDHNGSEIPFTWTPPGGGEAAITAHFSTDVYPTQMINPGVWQFSFTIEELNV